MSGQMIKNTKGSALMDWVLQRVTGLLVAAYAIVLTVFWWEHEAALVGDWQAYLNQTWMKIFTFFALLALLYHAWLGVWTVLTDYIKPLGLRALLQGAVMGALVFYLIWGVRILWGAV